MTTKYFVYSIIFLVLCITIIGLPLDLMSPDATLYGALSKNIFQNNDFTNLIIWGEDWLDKPHLPFWLSAISFKIFGFHNIAYKLPGVLLFFFGVYITYKFTKENYNEETAIIASIILLTSLHSVISNFDVRAEPFLTGFIIASLYWFYKYIKNKKIKDLLIGSAFCGFAIMTKGMFALIPIACAIGGEFLVKRQWKEILNPMWLVALCFILIFITPELYALYVQFDLHPEKLVFGKNNVSGLRFFFWDSQFGRFFNTGPIKGKGDIFFFIHTLLWAFLPWAILFYIATFLKVKRNFKKVNKNEEFFSLFATLSTIILFSLSKFQLAHYTNIVFPFMAIITADFIFKLKDKYQKLQKTFVISQWILISIALIFIPLLCYFLLPEFSFLFLAIVLIAVVLCIQIKKSDESKIYKLFFYSCLTYSVLYGFMMTSFYPNILKYQGYVHLAKYANTNFGEENIYYIAERGKSKRNFGFSYYSENKIEGVYLENVNKFNHKLFFVNEKELTLLKDSNTKYRVEKEAEHFRITRINAKFVNVRTRAKAVVKKFLIRLE